MDEIATLKQVPLFAKMDEKEIADVHAIMDAHDFPPGHVIIREGHDGDFFHVILDGRVQFLTQNADGTELALDEAGPGGYFGEVALLTGEPRTARVKALSAVRTLALDREEFLDFILKHPHAAIDILSVVGRRLIRTDKLLRESVSRNVNELEEQSMTLGQRIADGFATAMGSWTFIIVQSTILAFWVTLNLLVLFKRIHFDEYPFIFLNLALSFQAAYAAPIIMMSQNRQSEKDRLAAEVDHQVNRKAEIEAALILRRLDDIEQAMHHNHQMQCSLIQQ